jgi:hypothetical protein
MAIVKYADEVAGLVNRIDRQSLSERIIVDKVVQDITALELEHQVYLHDNPWRVKEISLAFSGAAGRDIDISKITGASVIQNLTDRFWIRTANSVPQKIVLTPGFYLTAATLGAELKAQLDANSVFAALGLVFTVAHNAATKQYTITNNLASPMTFYMANTFVPVRRNSTAAGFFGLTADQGPIAAIVSDDVADIGTETILISAAGDTSLSYVVTDPFDFDNDSYLQIATNKAAITVTSKVSYQIV